MRISRLLAFIPFLTGCSYVFPDSPSASLTPQHVIYKGQLKYFWCTSADRGNRLAWGLRPLNRVDDPVEVDIKNCQQQAERLEDRYVIIEGDVAEQGWPKLPLLMASSIKPLPQDAAEVAMQ